jgi:nitronate monooxygenase
MSVRGLLTIEEEAQRYEVGGAASGKDQMTLPALLADTLELPVVGSPLFIVSGPELVIAQCKAGIVGSFPALNARPSEKFDEWLGRIENELGEYRAMYPGKRVAPYAVNQICHDSNDRLLRDMELCVKHKVPIIITSLRPPSEIVAAAHSYGGLVFHDVINAKHARKAADQGVDGLILVCAGAGGHAGTLSPFALLREVKQWFKGTILLSGAISDGWSIAAALALGADLAYVGTRFIATAEANADPAYKKALTECAADDVVYTNLFTGVHGNYLGPSIAAAGLDPHNLPVADKSKMNFGSGGNTKAKVWRDIWGSGQGVGQISDAPPVTELVERLTAEFVEARSDFLNRASLDEGAFPWRRQSRSNGKLSPVEDVT